MIAIYQKKICMLVIVFALLHTTLCFAAENWLWIYSNDTFTMYLDSNSISYDTVNNIATFWTISEYPAAGTTYKDQKAADFSHHTLAILHTITGANNGHAGNRPQFSAYTPQYEPVVPGSMGDQLYTTVYTYCH